MKNKEVLKVEYEDFNKGTTYCIVNVSGDKFCYKNGMLHNEQGPAIVYSNGNQYYYRDGKLHREDGPAVMLHNGIVLFYRYGIMCNNLGNMIICQ